MIEGLFRLAREHPVETFIVILLILALADRSKVVIEVHYNSTTQKAGE